ncbi:MAG TPA: hypothetical protein VJ692_10045 [Nitrospiraceae bacterium]|nr:hypothetical protein [Nitrospiraceae bacterium]
MMDWLTVRNFGRVKYFHLSFVVIIGLPLFAQVYEVALRTLLKTPFSLSLTFPFTFKLLYVSSLCYAIGIAIYEFFCPSIIKSYETEVMYVDAAQHTYERAYLDRKYGLVLAHLKDTQRDIKNNLIDLKLNLDKLLSDPMSSPAERKEVQENLGHLLDVVYPSCIQAVLVKNFEDARHQYPLAIYTSGIFFMAGTFLLAFLLLRKTLHLFSV